MAGGFIFRLQKVLDHRVRIEDEKKGIFINSRLKYLKEKEKLEGLYKKLEESYNDSSEKSTGVFSYIAKYNYTLLLEERIEDQTKIVKLSEEDMDQKKSQLEESQRNRKAIDKLKENAHKQHKLFMDRLEQKQNDEFALYGYVRK